MIVNDIHSAMINNPVRKLKGKAELYDGSALINTFSHNGALKSFDIERVGEAKFFGYGICQKANIKLIDVNRELDITTAHSFKVYMGVDEDYISPFPTFYVTEVHRDENTGELSVTSYDVLNKAAAHTTSEVAIPVVTEDEVTTGYSVYEYALACANLLGIAAIETINIEDDSFNTYYEDRANFEGSETLREVFNAIAEVTQSIYYINAAGALVFKRLDKDGEAAAALTKDNYITLDSKTNKRLGTITSATELGDNVTVSTTESGSTQYVRNNPFWELREDIAELLDAAIAAVGGLTINQFTCSWRGNYLVEIGDKLALTTKDGGVVYSYLLNDKVSYSGGYAQSTEWNYTEDEADSATNANNLGEALKQTYARVDKANKQIELVAGETQANKSSIAALQINTDSINATIQNMETVNKESMDTINSDIATLTEKVNLAVTSEQLEISISSKLEDGVTKVETNTGFKFDDEGLTVSKLDSEMTTTITEDGMTVYKDGDEMLVANNQGVNAVNLKASTYLIIGNNSRFEDFADNRTGCFWIGGN